MKTNYTIEIQRRNVTPAQFLAYVRRRLKATGGDAFCGCLDLDYFAAGSEPNYDTERDGTHCISHSKPYSMQTYIRQDGLLYNEICEFEFDDEKTGYGYYYLVDAAAETEQDAETAPAAETETETTETARDAERDNRIAELMQTAIDCLGTRSAWERGVKAYAEDLLYRLRESIEWTQREGEPSPLESRETVRAALLNGAEDWKRYSWGGCSLIYNGDIAERLCTPSELKRKRGGELNPNAAEDWLDVQARALYQASVKVLRAYDLALDALREGARA